MAYSGFGYGAPVGGAPMGFPQVGLSMPPVTPVTPQVQQMFSMVDRDRSGSITATELQSVLSNGIGSTFSIRAVESLIMMFSKKIDHSIDIYEFQCLYDCVNKWSAIFRSYDRNNSGTIEPSELAQALTQIGYCVSPQFVNTIVSRRQSNYCQSLTFDQFLILCVKVGKLTEEFRRRDTSGCGFINIGLEDFLTIAMSSDS